MSELIAVVTRKGQVMLPAELRCALDLKQGDRVAFSLPNRRTGSATVRRAPARRESVVERTAGMLASDQPALSPEEEKAAAEQASAEDAIERMGQ